ncbi:hypothetical protein [Streptomyces sp. NPDC050534]
MTAEGLDHLLIVGVVILVADVIVIVIVAAVRLSRWARRRPLR